MFVCAHNPSRVFLRPGASHFRLWHCPPPFLTFTQALMTQCHTPTSLPTTAHRPPHLVTASPRSRGAWMLVNSGRASGLLTVTKNCRNASDRAARDRAGSEARGVIGAACAMLAEACECGVRAGSTELLLGVLAEVARVKQSNYVKTPRPTVCRVCAGTATNLLTPLKRIHSNNLIPFIRTT